MVSTIAQVIRSNFVHHFHAFLAAARINGEFCCDCSGLSLRLRNPHRIQVVGKDGERSRIEIQVRRKVDRKPLLERKCHDYNQDRQNARCKNLGITPTVAARSQILRQVQSLPGRP